VTIQSMTLMIGSFIPKHNVKVRGYIIRKEDFKVERIPSRIILPFRDSDASGCVYRRGKNRRDDERVKFINFSNDEKQAFDIEAMENDNKCEAPMATSNNRPSEIHEEIDSMECCEKEPNRYYNKVMKVIMNFDCILELEFNIDKDMVLTSVETSNVYDFRLLVNDEVMSFDNDIKFLNGDKITVKITRDDLESASEVVLVGYDPEIVFDSQADNETSLDEPINEEHILINPKE